MLLATILAVLAATTAPSDADRAAIEEKVVEIFQPYGGSEESTASWDYPIYSAEVTALIARWRAVTPEGGMDGLNDGDWLCQCLDWEPHAFAVTMTSIGMVSDDVAEVELTVDLGFGGPEDTRAETLTFKREDGVWKIDEMVSLEFPDGLKQALRETIAVDEERFGNRSS